MEFDRANALRRIAEEAFDVLVVGGGITGTGVALDAASRGLRTALIEKGDFASGTSSKSSKLVHGGIRYLQQKEVGLVYEALAERQTLRKTAPHLVRVLPFLLPVFTSDALSDGYIPVSMGNASDLADEFDAQRERFERATAAMWRKMAGWTRDQTTGRDHFLWGAAFEWGEYRHGYAFAAEKRRDLSIRSW